MSSRRNDMEQQTDDHHPPANAHEWRASVLRRLPWDALLAILGTIACAITMTVVIIKSNGDAVEHWTVSPAVYLAIISAAANILLRYTFSKGVEISWWTTAMKDDTRVKDLHNIWLHSTSLVSAVRAGRDFNLVALAAILLALVPANAPLAQRASTAASRVVTAEATVSLVAAQTINSSMATGMVTGRTTSISYVTPPFAAVLQNYLVSAPIMIAPDGALACHAGICRGAVRAAGYDMTCVPGSRIFDRSPRLPDEPTLDNASSVDPAVIFATEFHYVEWTNGLAAGEAAINLTAVFKQDGGCKGTLTLRNCTLVPATLEYRVVVANSTVALDGRYTYHDDKVVSYHATPGGSGPHESYHGGVSLALSDMFSSKVTLSFGGAVGMLMSSSGVTALRYQREKERLPVEDTALYAECRNYWLDPIDDILMAARSIAFRIAFEGNLTNVPLQTMQSEREVTELVYQSDFLFLGLALVFIVLSGLTVTPLLWNWWRLGREVSLSPVEVARAFAAPELLPGSGSNSAAEELMRDVGLREVRYGETAHGQMARVLAFAHPGVVQPPKNGVVYA
ncbi:hypothetical protein B0T14DRAFT_254301 [Immersiella caudata]|uniref:Uncharacterized protein n=1 Tax=Immersiella caudata TaxID=314043 RepID=A0AA39WK58_9PEZI|nr:hypothetical protein B0T14DRAFT_254301 [Immersiella caudata]